MHIKTLSILIIVLAACSTDNREFCDESQSCTDSLLTFCDVDGVNPTASRPNECIVPPSVQACNRAAPCTNPTAPNCTDGSMGECVPCFEDAHCGADLAFCSDANVCIGCRTSDDCTNAAEAICDEEFNRCRGCFEDSDCASTLCGLETDRVCVDEASIVYVSKTGSSSAGCGSQSEPCESIGLGVAQISPTRDLVLIGEGTYVESLIVSDVPVRFVSHHRSDNVMVKSPEGARVLSVLGTASVEIHHLVLSGTPDGNGSMPSLECNGNSAIQIVDCHVGVGILSTNGCAVIIDDSQTFYGIEATSGSIDVVGSELRNENFTTTISGRNTDITIRDSNILDNYEALGLYAEGGTVDIQSSTFRANATTMRINAANFVLRNNFFIGGPVYLDGTQGFSQVLEFNTFAKLEGSPLRSLNCSLSDVVAKNNLFMLAEGETDTLVDGCNTDYSLFDSNSTSNSGTHTNTVYANATFVDPAGGDYHLAAGSAGIDAADPAATLTTDFDGDARPQGAHDIGADEFVAP